MVSGKTVAPSRCSPSTRILELAQNKDSKTVWATTPSRKLNWGNQDPIWPLSTSALGAVPNERIQYLARHKRDFSAREQCLRKKEDEGVKEEEWHPRITSQSAEQQYQYFVRLSTPKRSSPHSSQEIRPPHTSRCEHHCPIWHVKPSVRTSDLTPRLLKLAMPKQDSGFTACKDLPWIVPQSATMGRASPRLEQLCLPKLKKSSLCFELGRSEEPIRLVSKGARMATASPHTQSLSIPKQLSKDYIPSRDSMWNQWDLLPL